MSVGTTTTRTCSMCVRGLHSLCVTRTCEHVLCEPPIALNPTCSIVNCDYPPADDRGYCRSHACAMAGCMEPQSSHTAMQQSTRLCVTHLAKSFPWNPWHKTPRPSCLACGTDEFVVLYSPAPRRWRCISCHWMLPPRTESAVRVPAGGTHSSSLEPVGTRSGGSVESARTPPRLARESLRRPRSAAPPPRSLHRPPTSKEVEA
jgi:hypothetical protein